MKKFPRLLTLFLAAVMLFSLIPGTAFAANEVDFDSVDVNAKPNTHVNTGNQRQDLLAVALSQLDYTEGYSNDTKYGTWYGLPFQAWCASFISWCARQAEIPTDILGKSALASPRRGYFDIPYYSGTTYTPLPGDLFFTQGFSHVGIVYYVEGEDFYCIEGNANLEYSEDGFWVIINKRKIKDYYFGVPAYEGGDKDHTYVRHVESAHPHKVYYQCTTCGDKNYTGYTEFAEGCKSCLSCGCTAAGAGYYQYLSDLLYPRLAIRDGHSASAEAIGGISDTASVRVLGTSGGWAYVEYYGVRGHVKLDNLTKYYGPPAAPKITTDRESYIWNEDVTVSWHDAANAEQFYLEILRDGETVVDEILGKEHSYRIEKAPAGMYEVRLKAYNLSGFSGETVHSFAVRDTYTVTFDSRGGTDGPGSVTQVLGDAVILPDGVPALEGYSFLGWTAEQDGTFAVYKPGEALTAGEDMTLYAVWKSADAQAASLEIGKMPVRTMFLQDETLDAAGLELHVFYSDGTGQRITEGYTLEGYSAAELGTVTISAAWEGLTVSFDVEIVAYIPGDIDLNKTVDRDDVMALLWHITFPDRFPAGSPGDFTGDGLVDRGDVMQLLWHITFPDRFPLTPEKEPSAQ